MSKMDNLRAMREARFERTGTAPARKPAPLRAVRPDEKPVPVAPEAVAEGLCGHKAISGRTCTRERGHTEKSHRYS